MEQNNSKQNKSKNIIFIIVLCILLVVLMYLSTMGKGPEKIDINKLETLITQNQVEAVYTQQNNSKGYILIKNSEIDKNDFPAKADYWFVYNANSNDLLVALRDDDTIASFEWQEDVAVKNWFDVIMPIVYISLILLAVFLLMRSISKANKDGATFIKNKSLMSDKVNVKFDDIAGIDEEKEELKEIVDFLKNPKKYSDIGARIPKGVLLVGSPGTGKTLLAKSIAGESNVPFFSISGSDFVELYVGVGASRVRDLFEQAKANSPCIVFIDEIDAVGRRRGSSLGNANDEREQTLNQLLVEMDGFKANEGIIVVAATNRSDILDPALTRPGRFDRLIYVYPPDVKGREQILQVHARNKQLAHDVDFRKLARLTSRFTGADLENLLNEAALLSARENRKCITMADITNSINKVTIGTQKKSRVVSEDDRKITAYHEAGHALVGYSLPHIATIQEISIIQRGGAGGYTLPRDDKESHYRSKQALLDEIAFCMGGRIAEELVFKDYTTGASNDIKQATNIARAMVTEWGMSSLGFIGFEDDGSKPTLKDNSETHNPYSEATALAIDKEIKAILDANYAKATDILQKKRAILDEIVKVLLAKETIYQDEFEMICSGKSSEEVIAYMDEKEKAQAIEREQHALDDELLKLNSRRHSKLETIDFMTKSANMSDHEKASYVEHVNGTYLLELNKILTSYKEKGVETDMSCLLSKTLDELNGVATPTLVDALVSINKDSISAIKQDTEQNQTTDLDKDSSNGTTSTDNESSDTNASNSSENSTKPNEDQKKKKRLFDKKDND